VFQVDSVFIDHLHNEYGGTDVFIISLVAYELNLTSLMIDIHQSSIFVAADKVYIIVIAKKAVLSCLFDLNMPHRMHMLFNQTSLQLLSRDRSSR